MPLKTKAEQSAEAARQINGFKDFALGGVRDKVAVILNMIGRSDGVFSTYSLHDISHVDAMLNMLDWLIPAETQEQLTPVEWLLIVLAFYFHDLGMVVSPDEFECRNENAMFRDFVDALQNDPQSQDYLDRLERIPYEGKDAFLFQEFIRANHARRIREWITGERGTTWGSSLTPIAEEISDMLDSLPPRFRRNLADVCESHHKDNLEDPSYFPLCQRYGASQAVANIQYAAILLRTADLLHITEDRTPSIMFRTLNISDLMGIDEWKKQMGTFSVHMKTRDFLPADPASHVIVVSADFDEERPFFVLTEYIAYANQQMGQNHRWAAKSQQQSDAKHYFFPWRGVQGDIRVEGNEPMPMRFELDRGRLLDLLVGHTIYNDPTVAVRELMQNAIDAVRYQNYLDHRSVGAESSPPELGQVNVFWNSSRRELVVQDQGVGMDMDVIRYHLMTVGASFYDSPAFREKTIDFIPISRFGIGILTCFMVSDQVEIRTWQGDRGHRIRMSSVQADYLLKELREGDRLSGEEGAHGTTVTLILRPSVDLSKKSVLDILKHWVVMPDCPVVYHEDNLSPVKIGFSSPSQALKHYLFQSKVEMEGVLDPKDVEIEEKELSINGAHYHLAYVVKRSFTPERDFVNNEKLPEVPSTCLEGIRVDSTLPGFKNSAAILSVRGNRAFRTTVSRDRLERDEEYLEVARLCGRMFQEHISNEVDRIKGGEGNPLSQASTAARWLFRTLAQATSSESIYTQSRKFYRALPHVILESRSAGDSPSSKPLRDLVSLDQLAATDVFWTIDARVVDYLGVISRDLGRELSFGEFLSGIAPDLLDSLMTPVVSDAHHYSHYILDTHCCEIVKFSKRHQQTAVKWVKRLESQPQLILSQAEYEAVSGRFKAINEYAPYAAGMFYGLNIFNQEDIIIGDIKGDVQDVKAVKTRVAVILASGSDWAELWIKVRKRVYELREKLNTTEFAAVFSVAVILHHLFSGQQSDSRIFGATPPQLIWHELLTGEESAEAINKLNFSLPDDIREFVANDNKFDATTYWLNWDE